MADLQALARSLCPHAADALAAGVADSRFAARLAAQALLEEAQAREGSGSGRPLPGDGPAVAGAGGRLRALVVPPGETGSWLAPMPLDALWPLAPAVRRRLGGLGLRTLGDVARAGRRALAAELGADGVRAHELACGIDRSPVRSLYPPREVVAACRPEGGLAGAVQIEAAALAAARDLADELALRAEGARTLWLLLEGDVPAGAARAFSAPTARREALREAARALAAEALARAYRAGPACTGVRLTARDLAPLPVRQEALWEEVPDRETRRSQVRRLVADLRRRFPGHAVQVGGQVTVPRRERMLACWDPYRFSRGLWEPS